MTSIQDTGSNDYILIEKLEGPAGTAYRWNRPGRDEIGLSTDRWLIGLPELDERSVEDDENPSTGVFVLEAILSDHKVWAQFKGVLPRYDNPYQLTLCEACEPDADASNPESAYNLADPYLGDYGSDLAVLPHLLRIWAEELVQGRLDPFGGPVGGTPLEQSEGYFSGLLTRAEITAHA
ncbi:hypothetical protein GO986_16440 [Deinococcus sp. HMF7620]|uniref:Uncharacterized protein n=1 Tax=Deinococcus arboris TaxID=2682977 RepID=A0A7C9I132_9DEIO|nr:hypothetical protein [Deinococcus arboris]MVN88335.1 hypothetical protein [Deinococcus arboris]